METSAVLYQIRLPYADIIPSLEKQDWDFVDANTGYLTHTLHPYPAKFIPQIPNPDEPEPNRF